MCGIVGFSGEGDRATLVAMTAALAHRGPDGEGFYQARDEPVYLGHRRLAVVDIAGGRQPMWDGDEQVGVIYNGEIYNHAELRAELETKGHRFKTSHCDTEVLVHGYKEWGERLPERLNGMFAFAVYDRVKHRLFLARDRFGEKPLYYTRQNGFFAFASELTALRRHPRFEQRLSERSIQKYFAHGFFPAPNTLFENCWKLPGGCRLTYDVTHATLRTDRFWKFSIRPDHGLTARDDERLSDELAGLVSASVKRRLVADVPVGIFLSGGIDSSAVLALAARHRPPESLETFTIGFTNPSYDESRWAEQVAAATGSRHHVETLNLESALASLPDILSRLDEPLGDPSILPTHLLSRFTSEKVTVALSGDGGDELFAGYDPFMALRPARIYDAAVPAFVHRAVRRVAALLPLSERNMSFDYKVRNALKGLSHPQALWNPVWLSPLDPGHAAQLFENPLPIEDIYSEVLDQWNASPDLDTVDKTLEFYTRFYLQDGILTKVDRASMMVSLEARAVFLDNEIVDFCQRLPNQFKFRNGQTKYLLKKALAKVLPASILNRPKKGFGIPLDAWLRKTPAPKQAVSLPGINRQWLESCWHAHRERKQDHRLLLWAHMSLAASLDGSRSR